MSRLTSSRLSSLTSRLSRLLLLDAVCSALYIWQLVFMFCWMFLNFLENSCMVVPLLVYYLHGVAMTSGMAFLLSFLEIVTGDNKVYSCWEEGHRRQASLGKMFQVFHTVLVLLHLFWFVFGLVNVLPPAVMTGFFIR